MFLPTVKSCYLYLILVLVVIVQFLGVSDVACRFNVTFNNFILGKAYAGQNTRVLVNKVLCDQKAL